MVRELEQAGFSQTSGGKGSHRKYVHPRFPGFVLVSGHDGDDAKPYLEKQTGNAIRQIQS